MPTGKVLAVHALRDGKVESWSVRFGGGDRLELYDGADSRINSKMDKIQQIYKIEIFDDEGLTTFFPLFVMETIPEDSYLTLNGGRVSENLFQFQGFTFAGYFTSVLSSAATAGWYFEAKINASSLRWERFSFHAGRAFESDPANTIARFIGPFSSERRLAKVLDDATKAPLTPAPDHCWTLTSRSSVNSKYPLLQYPYLNSVVTDYPYSEYPQDIVVHLLPTAVQHSKTAKLLTLMIVEVSHPNDLIRAKLVDYAAVTLNTDGKSPPTWTPGQRTELSNEQTKALRLCVRPGANLAPGPGTTGGGEPDAAKPYKPSRDLILEFYSAPSWIFVKAWNQVVDRFLGGLRESRSGNPVSFLPRFSDLDRAAPQGSNWVLAYELHDPDLKSTNGEFTLLGREAAAGERRYARLRSLRPGRRSANSAPEVFAGRFPNAHSVGPGDGIDGLRISLEIPSLPDSDGLADSRGLSFQLSHSIHAAPAKDPLAYHIRFGSFDLSIADIPDGKDPLPTAAIALKGRKSGAHLSQSAGARLDFSDTGRVIVKSELDVALRYWAPGGQDNTVSDEFVPTNYSDFAGKKICDSGQVTNAPEGQGRDAMLKQAKWNAMFEDEPPLTIYRRSAADPTNYILEATEAKTVDLNPTIDLRVFIQNPEGANDAQGALAACDELKIENLERVFVADRNPFLTARVAYRPIGRNVADEIASWTNRPEQPRGWQVRFAPPTAASPACLTLPPQGIGETMLDGSTPPSEPSQYNFGPPANFTLSLGEEGRSYSTPPWDLRSLLSNPQLAPYVQQIDYELLYGLSCVAQKPLIRLLDTFGVIGSIPGRPRDTMRWPALPGDTVSAAAYQKARYDWAFVYRQFRNRLAVMEPVPWNAASAGGESITLSKNLSCWIRLPGASNLKLPVDLTAADFPKDFTRLDELKKGTLLGGATRGIVSKNVYIASVFDPADKTLSRLSSSAGLSQFAFTALGGFGNQMAGFQNDLTRIYGDVHLGRTYRYKVERIGRIACFWNVAKHVVVFERRTAPADGFAYPNKEANLLGWPLLRKVRDYVEIIDERLDFPASGSLAGASADQIAELKRRRGPVTGIQFAPGAQFEVRSEWGIDVGNFGWKIPLWNPTAPETEYPKPKFDLRMAPQDSGKECELKRFAKPDQVFFFTLTSLPGATPSGDPPGDPRLWPPQPGIDFVNCPDPRPATDFKEGDPRQYTAPERPSTPGLSACTFELETAGPPINMMVDRSASPMTVKLSSITVCRSSGTAAQLPAADLNNVKPEDLKDPAFVVAALRDIERRLTEVFQKFLEKFPVDAVFDPGLGNRIREYINTIVKAEFDKLRGQVAQLRTQLTSPGFPFAQNAIQGKIQQVEQNAEANVLGRIDKAIKDAQARANTRILELQPAAYTQPWGRSLISDLGTEVTETLLLLGSAPGQLNRCFAQMVSLLNAYVTRAEAEFNAALDRLIAFAITPSVTLAQCQDRLRVEFAGLTAVEDDFFRTCMPLLPQGLTDCFASWRSSLNTYFGLVDVHLTEAIHATDVAGFRNALQKPLKKAVQDALQNVDGIRNFLSKYTAIVIPNTIHLWTELVNELQKSLPDIVKGVTDPWQKAITAAIAKDLSTIDKLRAAVLDLLKTVQEANGAIRTVVHDLSTKAQAAATKAADLYNAAFDDFYRQLQKAEQKTKDLAQQFANNAEQMQGELIRYKDKLVNSARDWAEQNTAPLLDKINGSGAVAAAYQAGDTALRLVRAFGDPPRTSQMRFEQSQLGYYFKQSGLGVDLSPAYMALDQGAAALEALRPLGLRMPCAQVLDQLVPASLKNFDFSKIFPSFAGIDFTHLLGGFKVPEWLDSRHVKITHGIDVQRRRAFAKAEVSFKLDTVPTLLSIGPVKLTLPEGTFNSTLTVAASESGVDQRQVTGSLRGDWQLTLAGTEILTLAKAELRFDDHGGLHFNIDPTQVRLPDVMKFVMEKLASLIDPKSGLSFGSVPKGFRCTLDLPVPDTSAATSGISGLRLTAGLALLFDDDFKIELDCGLGRPDAPFNVAFFILGGGGYLTARVFYVPKTGEITCGIDLAVTASASLAIALGPIRGGVYVYFGVTANFISGGSSNAFGVVFIIRGEVNICGIVSATVVLSLSANYNASTGELVGQGKLTISIKICWCFTLNVNESITYSLKSGKSSTTASLYQDAPVLLAFGNGTASDRPLVLGQRHPQRPPKVSPPPPPKAPPRSLTPRDAAKSYSKMLV